MILDRLVRFLFPRQGHFFDLLEGIATQITAAADTLTELIAATGHAQMEAIAARLKTMETAGDDFERQMHAALDKTFVTPIDREDLATLAKALDDVVDGIEHAATFAALYQFDQLTDPMREQVRLVVAAAKSLAETVPLLRKFGNPEAIHEKVAAINKLESEADGVFRTAVANLFTSNIPAADLVRQKDMLTALEECADECEDAMDVIRSVMVKNG